MSQAERMLTHWVATAQTGQTLEKHIALKAHWWPQASKSPTRLVRQHSHQHALQSDSERLGQTGVALAGQHTHCHGSMGTQSEGLDQRHASRHWQKQHATVAGG